MKCAVGVHHDQTVDRAFADDVEVLAHIHGDFARQELAVSAKQRLGGATKLVDQVTVSIQDDDGVLAGVGDVKRSGFVHEQAGRRLQDSLSELRCDLEICIQFDDAPVAGIGHVEETIRSVGTYLPDQTAAGQSRRAGCRRPASGNGKPPGPTVHVV